MKNILYTRDVKYKINPAYFDKVITPLVRSTTTNSIGEKVEAYTPAASIRAMVQEFAASMEEVTIPENQISKDIIYILTYNNAHLLNEKNRISYSGKTLQIIDSTPDAYARGRFVRVKAMYIG